MQSHFLCCAISAFQHQRCEFESSSWWGLLDTSICDKVCQWFASVGVFLRVSSTNKTDRHDITEILLIVALNTITLTLTTKVVSLIYNLLKTTIRYKSVTDSWQVGEFRGEFRFSPPLKLTTMKYWYRHDIYLIYICKLSQVLVARNYHSLFFLNFPFTYLFSIKKSLLFHVLFLDLACSYNLMRATSTCDNLHI
jgi:hypothetical protein